MRHTFTLANGVEIPAVGFGTYKAADNTDEAIISEAIRQGYRHLDTAAFYFNEEAVGKAVRESGIPREEIFLTSKVWKDHLGYDSTLQEFESTCKRLGTDYLDLYLIHWPRPSDLNAEWRDLDVETWKALEFSATSFEQSVRADKHYSYGESVRIPSGIYAEGCS